MKGRERIPDGINRIAGTLSEVKNVAKLSFTRQLHDYLDYAVEEGLQFNLYVRKNTKLSRPLQEAVNQGLINLEKIIQ